MTHTIYDADIQIVHRYHNQISDVLVIFFVFSAVDPTIEEAIASVIWCEPRLSADIPELMIVSILSCISLSAHSQSWMKFVAPSNEMNSFHCAYYPTSHI